MKDWTKSRSVDFLLPQFNKKLKSDNVTNIYSPDFLLPKGSYLESLFYSTKMSSLNDKEELNKAKISLNNEKESVSDDSDDLDSLLQGLQNLSFDSKEPVDDRKSELYKFKKDVLDIISEPFLDTSEFDKLYDETEIIELKETVKPLTDEENRIVDKVLRRGQSGQVSQFKKVTVDYKDIYRLYPETWLNDEIVNFYFELLSERAATTQNLPKIHCFNTFFYSTLRDQGFDKVKRWTKRIDIFAKDLIFIPINQSYHWVLGVIDIKNKKVLVYDSLGGNHDHTLSLFLNYLEKEHLDKKKAPYNTSDWKKETPKDIPQQGNMSDCGAFTCTFAERLSRNESFNFSQQDMVPIRRRMVLNILNKTI